MVELKMKNRPISELTKEDMKDIKLIIFDVDGVLVPRGTEIKQNGDVLTLVIKRIQDELIENVKKLSELGFEINISSGRGLYMLQEMFRKILPYISLTCENGSITWYKGKIYQHVNSYEKMKDLMMELQKIKHNDFKAFEPKEFIITLQCKKRVMEIEDIVSRYNGIYAKWTLESYDIGIKKVQTKGIGIRGLIKILKLKKENVLAIGDNINDKELLDEAGIGITADKTRLDGDFFVDLDGKDLPAKQLMDRVIEVMSE